MTAPLTTLRWLAVLLTLLTTALAQPAHQMSAALAVGLAKKKPFPMGKVPVVMYHSIGDKEKYMARSYAHFQHDLARLRKMGFRPVTLSDYVDGKFKIPGGTYAVVMTFDDFRESQIRLKKDGKVSANCFVGQWMEFAAKHPDFPVKGTFFILPTGSFGKKAEAKTKLKTLLSLGCELASHTYNHRFLSKISDEQVARELGQSYEFLVNLGVKPRAVWHCPSASFQKTEASLRAAFGKAKNTTTTPSASRATFQRAHPPTPSETSSACQGSRLLQQETGSMPGSTDIAQGKSKR